jgi:hypothetical protein
VQNKHWWNSKGKVCAADIDATGTGSLTAMQSGQLNWIWQSQTQCMFQQTAAEMQWEQLTSGQSRACYFTHNVECVHVQDLDKYDICYDKCTKGKPCHTCIFKDVSLLAWCHNVVPCQRMAHRGTCCIPSGTAAHFNFQRHLSAHVRL